LLRLGTEENQLLRAGAQLLLEFSQKRSAKVLIEFFYAAAKSSLVNALAEFSSGELFPVRGVHSLSMDPELRGGVFPGPGHFAGLFALLASPPWYSPLDDTARHLAPLAPGPNVRFGGFHD